MKEMSLEELRDMVRKYETRSMLARKNRPLYDYIRKHDLMGEIGTELKDPPRRWTKEECMEVASRYMTRISFRNEQKSAYNACIKNGWLDELCEHMKGKEKWTKERVRQLARQYTSRMEFNMKDPKAYYIAQKRGWLDDVCHNMKRQRECQYTIVKCLSAFRDSVSKTDFIRRHRRAYEEARKNGWLETIYSIDTSKF